jgi:hypothetical protein
MKYSFPSFQIKNHLEKISDYYNRIKNYIFHHLKNLGSFISSRINATINMNYLISFIHARKLLFIASTF